MKTLLITLILGCSPILASNASFGADEVKKQTESSNQYPAGSYNNPILLDLKGIKNYDMLEFAQKEYMRKHYDGYRTLGKEFTMIGKRYILILSVTDHNEDTVDDLKLVYFDMTDAYKKLKISKDKKTREKIKELETDSAPMTEEELMKKLEERKAKKDKKSKR